MKRKTKIAIAVLMPFGLLVGLVIHHGLRCKMFIKKQSSYLQRFDNLDAIHRSGDILVATHEYPDGSWVAIKLEHSCCGGDGFDCIVARDEKNSIYVCEGFSVCGYESSGELFRYIPAKNSGEFFRNSEVYHSRLKFTKKE